MPEYPSLARGVTLVGELRDTGFVERQWLVERDGRFLQLSELLYRISACADGSRSLGEIAHAVTDVTVWLVTVDDVRTILATKLIPLGIVAAPERPALAVVPGGMQSKGRSPLQINLRVRTLGPEFINRVARVVQYLFAPPVVVTLLGVAAVAYGWLYGVRGVSESVRAALYMPGGLLLVFGLVIASGIVHEFGHAAALRYGGGRARGMGVGVYIVYPTFYTDTSDAYRLGRWARLRTDLGGMYFHLLFGLTLIGLYFATGQEILLAVVLVITGDIAYQLMPFVRLDGYWALSDLTGIPDPLSQAQPFLRSLVPNVDRGPVLPLLRRGPRVAFLAYLVLTVPLLALFGLFAVLGFPRFMAIGWDALRYQMNELAGAHGGHDVLFLAATVAQIVLLTLSLLAATYFVLSMLGKAGIGLWRWSRPTGARRAVGTLTGAVATTSIAFLWFPALGVFLVPSLPGVQEFDVTSRHHVLTAVSYAQSPPVGGNHYPVWQNCGFYDTAIPNERGVHALEHGAVWITYRPDLPPEQVRTLHELARDRSYILVSPYPGLDTPVVASAWARQAKLQSAGDPLLARFIDTFRLGRQAPERGAQCTDGFGVPVP